MNLRWRNKLGFDVPPELVFDPSRHDVVELEGNTLAKAFVLEHHYSGSCPTLLRRFGLYRDGDQLAGVAVFSRPMNDRSLTNALACSSADDALELGRFVLLDGVEQNAETWFLRRCFDVLKAEKYAGVVSFSDPIPREAADGRRVFAGHLGRIYQAHNAPYLGRGARNTLKLLPDATVVSRRGIQKVRALERNWLLTVRQLEAHGAELLDVTRAEADDDYRRDWLRRQLAAVTRSLRHPGNHKYAWAFSRAGKKRLERVRKAPPKAVV